MVAIAGIDLRFPDPKNMQGVKKKWKRI